MSEGELSRAERIKSALRASGAHLPDNATWEDYEAMAARVTYVRSATPWWIGDLYNRGEELFGEDAAQAWSSAIVSPSTMQQYSHWCRVIPEEYRRPSLSFDLHAEIAKRFPARDYGREEQLRQIDYWLDYAEQQAGVLTRRDINAEILEYKSTKTVEATETHTGTAEKKVAEPEDYGRRRDTQWKRWVRARGRNVREARELNELLGRSKVFRSDGSAHQRMMGLYVAAVIEAREDPVADLVELQKLEDRLRMINRALEDELKKSGYTT